MDPAGRCGRGSLIASTIRPVCANLRHLSGAAVRASSGGFICYSERFGNHPGGNNRGAACVFRRRDCWNPVRIRDLQVKAYMPENELWLTAQFNEYLAGLANAILAIVNVHVKDPAHPGENWIVCDLGALACL